jgi:hypothetical protein
MEGRERRALNALLDPSRRIGRGIAGLDGSGSGAGFGSGSGGGRWGSVGSGSCGVIGAGLIPALAAGKIPYAPREENFGENCVGENRVENFRSILLRNISLIQLSFALNAGEVP